MAKEPILELSFLGGIDEAARPEIVDPSRGFTVLENVRQDNRGGATKRRGFDPLTRTRLDTSTRTAARKLLAHRDQACVIDQQLEAYDPTMLRWVPKGRVSEAKLTRSPLPYPGATPYKADLVHSAGYTVAAYMTLNQDLPATGFTLTVTVTDASTGVNVRQDIIATQLQTSNVCKLCVIGGTTVVLVYATATNTVSARTLSLANPAAGLLAGWSGATAIVTDAASGIILDTHGLEDRFALAYANNSGGASRFTVRTFNSALALLETRTISTASADVMSTTLAGSNALLWIGYSVTAGAFVLGVSGTSLATTISSSSVLGLGGIAMGIAVTGASSGCLVVSFVTTLVVSYSARFANVAGATTLTGSGASCSNTLLTTRPWTTREGRVHCAVVPYFAVGGNSQKAHFVIDVGESTDVIRVVANISARQSLVATVGPIGTLGVCHAAILDGDADGQDVDRIAVLNITQRSSLAVNTGAGTEAATLSYEDVSRWQAVEHHEVTVLAGGKSDFFDGQRVDEVNFLLRPDAVSIAIGAGTGITGTELRYCVIWEKNDNAGRVHWSAPSDATTIVSPANQAVDITLASLPFTTHSDSLAATNPARAAIYRSGDIGSGPYRRVGTVNNDPSAFSVSFHDTMSKATWELQPELYCVGPGGPTFEPGAEQVHQCPPATTRVEVLNDMLVAVADDERTLFYAAQPIVGEGQWFNDNFQLPILEGGRIVTTAVQDGTLYVFKRRGIFALSGVAPAGNGSQGGLGDPRRLAVDVGANQTPTCITGLGVFFVSDRGIEILTRSQTVEYIGEPVQETFAAFPIVTSMTFDPASSCVIIELAAATENGAVTGAGRTLVFDTRAKVWQSVDRRRSAAGVVDAPAQDGTLVHPGAYAWLGADGYVNVESASSHLDPASAWVKQRAATSWVHLAGLQGEQNIDRVLTLAAKHTEHDFQISIYRDYLDTNPETRTFTAAQMSTLARQWLDREVVQSTSQSIKVVIEDLPPSSGAVGTGKGATWVCLTFSGEPHRGPKRTTAVQRGGS